MSGRGSCPSSAHRPPSPMLALGFLATSRCAEAWAAQQGGESSRRSPTSGWQTPTARPILPSVSDSGSSRRRIRVLQVSHDLRIGGLQSVVVALAGGLDRDRYEVSVCALRAGGPLESQLATLGIPVFLL